MKPQGMAGGPGKKELIIMLVEMIGSSSASFECSEVVDMPAMAGELLCMILSLYGASPIPRP